MIYLDHAATTVVYPEVVEQMNLYHQKLYSNPSGGYEFASDCKEMLRRTRERIADSIGANIDEIYFTSGGTESDNWAIKGIAESMKNKGRHIITSQIEHHAVLRTCQYLEKKGYQITYLSVDKEGMISLEELEKAIRPDTILISIMYANNEIGTIQPVEMIGKIAKKYGVLFHTDAVQAYQHEKIDVKKMNIDLMSVSSHKFRGPKGTGFLYVQRNVLIPSYFHGGGQEFGKRAGTENVPAIMGMGMAVAMGQKNYSENRENVLAMRKFLIDNIKGRIPYSKINGSLSKRLPGNVNVSFEFIEGESLIILLDMEKIYVSGGSACASAEHDISHVIKAIGVEDNYARGTIRISIDSDNTMQEMKYFMDQLVRIVEQLREFSDEYQKVKNKFE